MGLGYDGICISINVVCTDRFVLMYYLYIEKIGMISDNLSVDPHTMRVEYFSIPKYDVTVESIELRV